MADYWKSQARKYCDFCKCWIADNKPSIEYHENGKKHKENVTKRLKEIHKNSAKQAKQLAKYENDMEKMEKAAMAAYLKDVESNNIDMMANEIISQKKNRKEASSKKEPENPNYVQPDTSSTQSRASHSKYLMNCKAADIDPFDPYANQKLANIAARKAKTKKEAKKSNDKSQDDGKSEKGKNKKSEKNTDDTKKSIDKIWYEAKSQGHSYYWNIETNESVWEPPIEGFKSLEEQAEELKEQEIQEKFFEELEKEEETEKAVLLEEQRANAEREKFKEIRTQHLKNQNATNDESNDNVNSPDVPYRRNYDIPEKPQPYGSWTVVKTIKPVQVDLQLPKVEKPVAAIQFEEQPRQREFKEKTITKLDVDDSDDESCAAVSFKKRKFGNKSVRKRIMDN